MQTQDFCSPEVYFSAEYAYLSSTSASWRAHAAIYAKDMIKRFSLDSNSMVCEVAANDGYLLKNFVACQIPCYGVEPTAGTAKIARDLNIEIVEDFFSSALAQRLQERGKSADLIAANNVLAHVPNIGDFVLGFSTLLKPTGVATFEFPHLVKMVENDQFDTAYHEHFSYLSLTAVKTVFDARGLSIFDVEELPTHGGSLRVFSQRADAASQPIDDKVAGLLEHEVRAGITTPSFYEGFQARAEQIKNGLLRFLLGANEEGKTVAAYGAAAKGNTLLNFAGIGPDLVQFVVDRSPSKQGRFLPGSHIPIYAEDRLRVEKPDYVVVLPWNLRGEVTDQLAYIRQWGGRFVFASPMLSIE